MYDYPFGYGVGTDGPNVQGYPEDGPNALPEHELAPLPDPVLDCSVDPVDPLRFKGREDGPNVSTGEQPVLLAVDKDAAPAVLADLQEHSAGVKVIANIGEGTQTLPVGEYENHLKRIEWK